MYGNRHTPQWLKRKCSCIWSCLRPHSRVDMPEQDRASRRREVTMPLHTPVTILVMDHASSFARALAVLLRRDGATVDTTDTGNRALARLEERCYDIVLCDVQMPDLDGPTFYGRLILHYPSLSQRVIFLTGDILSAESMVFLEQSGQAWIPKPFTAAAVRRAVAQALRTLKSSD